MGRLVAQFKIMAKPVLGSLAPALFRLGLVLLGVILGLIWAYQIAPVKFYDAEPVHLAQGYKDQWIKMTAAELALTGNVEEARNKLISAGATADMISQLIEDNQATDPQLVSELQPLLEIANNNQQAIADQAAKIEHSTFDAVLGPLVCLLGTAVIGIILALVMTFYWAVPVGKWAPTKKTAGRPAPRGVPGEQAAPASAGVTTHAERVAENRLIAEQKTDFVAAGEAPPVSQHMSSYAFGDDLYDDSFSIETDTDEFLGECGSGISETIGVGEPKKVTATEVWLFDKNDIRTVTKVLMSRHAFNDQALRTKLAPKGEAVLVEPGMVTMLETQTLRVQVRVMALEYGAGPLPPESYFQRLTVELAAWRKDQPAGADSGQPQSTDPSDVFGDTTELLNY